MKRPRQGEARRYGLHFGWEQVPVGRNLPLVYDDERCGGFRHRSHASRRLVPSAGLPPDLLRRSGGSHLVPAGRKGNNHRRGLPRIADWKGR